MPRIEYAPPAHRGVTSIMGVGADEDAMASSSTERRMKAATWASIGVWGLGFVTGSSALKRVGFAAAVVSFGMGYAAKKSAEKEAAQAAATAQGFCCP